MVEVGKLQKENRELSNKYEKAKKLIAKLRENSETNEQNLIEMRKQREHDLNSIQKLKKENKRLVCMLDQLNSEGVNLERISQESLGIKVELNC